MMREITILLLGAILIGVSVMLHLKRQINRIRRKLAISYREIWEEVKGLDFNSRRNNL